MKTITSVLVLIVTTIAVAFAQSPTVSITYPGDNNNFTTPANITITADADDNGSITKVEFYEGTNLLGEDLTSPYSFDWTNIPAGSYVLTAVATDDESNSTTSDDVTINVFADDGDWTLNGNDMNSAVPGNVGIGTTTPASKLQVQNGTDLDPGSVLSELGATTSDVGLIVTSHMSNGINIGTMSMSMDDGGMNVGSVSLAGGEGADMNIGVMGHGSGDNSAQGNAGVFGTAEGANTYNIGVRGDAEGDGGGINFGVMGGATGANQVNTGVKGEAEGATFNLGVSGVVRGEGWGASGQSLLENNATVTEAGGTAGSINIENGSTVTGNALALSGGINVSGSVLNAYGVRAKIDNEGGTITKASAIDASINHNSGSLTEAYGVGISLTNGSGLDNAYGIDIAISDNNASLENAYGIRIQDVQATTNQFAISQEGSDDINFFAGKVGIGLTPSSYELEVFGTIRMDDGNQGMDYVMVGNEQGVARWEDPLAFGLTSTFRTENNVTSNSGVNASLELDDFVFGSTQLDRLFSGQNSRMLFDKSKSAFRAGYTNNNIWDDAERGEYTAAFGLETRAQSYGSFVIGRLNKGNDGTYSTSSWVATEPVFEIGIGDVGNNANAMTVLKNGNVGIGTFTPSAELDVAGSIRMDDGNQGTDYIMVSDASGVGRWADPTALGLGSGGNDNDWAGTGTGSMYTFNLTDNVGIGTTTPAEKLEVAGKTKTTNLQITNGAANGFILQGDANGNVNWTDPASLSNNSGWTRLFVGTGLIYPIDLGDYVGIGTDNPGTKLEIIGKTRTTDLQITNGATDGFILQGDAYGTVSWANPASLGLGGDDNDWDIAGNNMFPSNLTNNIGIGTNDPAAKLMVQEGNLIDPLANLPVILSSELSLSASSDFATISTSNTGADFNSGVLGFATGDGAAFHNIGVTGFVIGDGAGILNTALVGLATGTGNESVNTGVEATAAQGDNNIGGALSAEGLNNKLNIGGLIEAIGTADLNYGVRVAAEEGAVNYAGYFLSYGEDVENFGVWASADGSAGDNYGVWAGATGGTNNYAGWFDAGDVIVNDNVGIGTSSPREKLDVNGKVVIGTQTITAGPHTDFQLSVDGKIVTTEIVCTLDGWWPDHVFDQGYNLKTLKELKEFIEQNGHLPEIPSQNEVAQNGVSLGEMNKLLLQKIEELTLYVLEQDHRIQELEETK